MPNNQLKRSLSLSITTLYGLGTILGAGIYVLVGKIAGISGIYAPFAFVTAAILATFSGLSYAELTSRYPKSAGEAIYIQQGLNIKMISVSAGLLIVISGIVSTATMTLGFVGYLQEFVQISDWVVITLCVVCLGGLAIWGIQESAIAVTVITVIETVGLLIILWSGRDLLTQIPERLPEFIPPFDAAIWTGILAGSFVAFYAFIGFEDMVNLAEEVKNPTRNLPRAIIIALVVATILYMSVSFVAVLSATPEQLAQSDAPLALVYKNNTGSSAIFISLISLFAISNGALMQIIMGSRILYGMSRQNWLPSIFGSVHAKTKTPIFSTALVTIIILILALWLPLLTLAKATSFVIIVVFILVNLSLCRIKLKDPNPQGIFKVPYVIPLLGTITSTAFLLFQLFN